MKKLLNIPMELYNITPILLRAIQCAKAIKIKSKGSLKYKNHYYDAYKLDKRIERTEFRLCLMYIQQALSYILLLNYIENSLYPIDLALFRKKIVPHLKSIKFITKHHNFNINRIYQEIDINNRGVLLYNELITNLIYKYIENKIHREDLKYIDRQENYEYDTLIEELNRIDNIIKELPIYGSSSDEKKELNYLLL